MNFTLQNQHKFKQLLELDKKEKGEMVKELEMLLDKQEMVHKMELDAIKKQMELEQKQNDERVEELQILLESSTKQLQPDQERADLVKMHEHLVEEYYDVSERFNIISAHKQRLQEQNLFLGALPENQGRLQKMVEKLPGWMKTILAPKGAITGAELGSLMGTFVSISAYIMTPANQKVKITAMSALASLGGVIIGTVFNNIVTFISTAENVGFQHTLLKALTSVPWILFGGLVPLGVGGFIHQWRTRVIVTASMTLLLMIIFVIIWTMMFKIPKWREVALVFIGVIGIALAAGAPEVLNLIVNSSSHQTSECPTTSAP